MRLIKLDQHVDRRALFATMEFRFMDLKPMNQPQAKRLRIFLADNHPLLLDGMKMRVAADEALELVGEATDGPEALRCAIELDPDVAVFDLSMPGMNGFDIAHDFLAARPDGRVLIMSAHEDAVYLRRLLKVGVSGYILKRSSSDELIRGIHAVAAGGVFLDPAIARLAFGRATAAVSVDDGSSAIAELSARELEVFRLASIGHSTKAIASKIQIGPKSVETYKARAMEKLGFCSRVEVIRFASGMGWLDVANL